MKCSHCRALLLFRAIVVPSFHHDRSPSVTSSYHFNFDKEGHLITFLLIYLFLVTVLKGTENEILPLIGMSHHKALAWEVLEGDGEQHMMFFVLIWKDLFAKRGPWPQEKIISINAFPDHVAHAHGPQSDWQRLHPKVSIFSVRLCFSVGHTNTYRKKRRLFFRFGCLLYRSVSSVAP